MYDKVVNVRSLYNSVPVDGARPPAKMERVRSHSLSAASFQHTAADACVIGKDDGAREQAERGSRLSADQGDAEIQGVLTDLLSPSTALVKHATQCGPSRVEIRSLENEIIVVQVSERGWEVVSRSNTQQLVGACYETITALMMRVSKGYMAAFSSEIARCLTEQRT